MSKINMNKAFNAVYNGEKMPRKAKKTFFGKRKSKNKIKAEIIAIMSSDEGVNSSSYCPNCGCNMCRGTGNMTEYPEHWENFYCIKCNELIGSIDNSEFIHVLED